jgi:hypothetical protein
MISRLFQAKAALNTKKKTQKNTSHECGRLTRQRFAQERCRCCKVEDSFKVSPGPLYIHDFADTINVIVQTRCCWSFGQTSSNFYVS